MQVKPEKNIFDYEKELAMQNQPYFQYNHDQPLAGLENSYPIFHNQFLSYVRNNQFSSMFYPPNTEMQFKPNSYYPGMERGDLS
jgi:hypothetical protein